MEIKDLKVGDFLNRPGFGRSNTGVFRVYSIGSFQNHDDFIKTNTYDFNYLCANVDSLDSKGKTIFDTFYNDDLAECEIITYEKYQEILKELDAKALEGFSEYVNVLRTVFPNRTVTVNEGGIYYSYILIDEETVNSSNGYSSTVIRDFVFRLKFSYDNSEKTYVLSGISGQIFKATRRQAEFGYAHSHVTSSGTREWGGCCFGGATDLAKTRGKLMAAMEPIKFQLFLYQLKDFLKYESLKGGPYRRISLMHSNTRNNGSIPHTELENVESHIGTFKKDVIEKNGTIICKFDRDDLSRKILNTGQIPIKYIGKMVDGDFITVGGVASNGDNMLPNYLTASGLNVSDDHCSINLKKVIHNEEVRDESDLSNAPDYVDPRFMDAYENRFKGSTTCIH
jgi:hypothetical protein